MVHLFEKLIPLLIHNCLAERSLPVYGDGSNIRDWLYVKDHCRALDLVCKGRQGEAISEAPTNGNLDVVHLIRPVRQRTRPKWTLPAVN